MPEHAADGEVREALANGVFGPRPARTDNREWYHPDGSLCVDRACGVPGHELVDVAGLRERTAELEAEVERQKVRTLHWMNSYNSMTEAAREVESERAALAARIEAVRGLFPTLAFNGQTWISTDDLARALSSASEE